MYDDCIADSSIFYFVIMVRHGAHVIFTQMVSTHEAMVRGTLDFPNLISLNNVTQDFVVDVEVYGMVNNLSFILISETGFLILCLCMRQLRKVHLICCCNLHTLYHLQNDRMIWHLDLIAAENGMLAEHLSPLFVSPCSIVVNALACYSRGRRFDS